MTLVRWLRNCTCLASLLLANPIWAQRIVVTPRLHAGQTLTYQIELSGSRSTKVESQVTAPQSPPSTDENALCLLHVDVVDVSATGFRLKTYLSERNSTRTPQESSDEQKVPAPDKLVEVRIATDGSASQIQGFDKLSAVQQYAWNTWLGRFTSAMTFPKSGVRRGQRWETSGPETSPALITGLSWERKYEYVKQEACRPSERGPAKDKSGKIQDLPEMCAVVFVRARLRQKSSPNDTTPRDYKLRGLMTRGNASGENETILYLSVSNGLLIRSTEDVQQSMDVTVALADSSNQVRYRIAAKSRSKIELLSDAP